MGDRVSVADAYLYALTSWGQASWLKSYHDADIHFDGLAAIEVWYGRMRGRDAVRKSIQQEGLAFH